MKDAFTYRCALVLLLAVPCCFMSYSQSVGFNTTAPHASAIVDIVSTNRGLLIPRMTRAQRDLIPMPVTGLWIYQLNETPGFYFYSSGWKMIAPAAATLTDTDADTKIQVEEAVDEDIIRFDLSGFEAMVLRRNASNVARMDFPGNNKNVLLGDLAGNTLSAGSTNTAVGTGALRMTTTGSQNTALGIDALKSNTDNLNTAIGASALFSNTTGTANTAIGSYAVNANTTGDSITAIGFSALRLGTSSRIVAAGYNSLGAMTTGLDNTAIGARAAEALSTGNYNTAFGVESMVGMTSGTGNTVIGYNAGDGTTNTEYNTAIGGYALNSNTTGDFNTAIGYSSMHSTTGGSNTAAGSWSMFATTSATNTTALGAYSLYAMTNDIGNTGIGARALYNNAGSHNTGVGYSALNINSASSVRNVAFGATAFDSTNVTHSDCIAIGYQSGIANSSITHSIALGANALASGSNVITLGSIQGINGGEQTVHVGIGTTTPNNSAILDVSATDRGMLFPRMNSTLRQLISSPPAGLMVYDTDTDSFWYYNGTAWVNLDMALTSMGAMAGETLVFDGNDWTPGYPVALRDLDGDTWASLEHTPDADELRIQLGFYIVPDEERFLMRENTNGHLLMELPNNDRSIYLGPAYFEIDDQRTGNTALGSSALNDCIGNDNTAVGADAASSIILGEQSVAIGSLALRLYNGGDENVGIGYFALGSTNATGVSGNVSIGSRAGSNLRLTSEDQEVSKSLTIGFDAQTGGVFSSAAIGARAYAANSNCLVLGSVEGVNNANESVKVGIGTTAPSYPLHIVHNSTSSDPHILLENTTNGNGQLQFRNGLTDDPWRVFGLPAASDANASLRLFFNQDRFTLYGNGNALLQGNLTQNSDSRLKHDIRPLSNTLASLREMNGYRYHWIDQKRSQETQIGLIAQEVEPVFPQLVKEDDMGYLALNYAAMTAVLLEALKELHAREELIKARQVEQHARIQELQAKLNKMNPQLPSSQQEPTIHSTQPSSGK